MEALKGLYHADKLDEQSFVQNFTIRIKEFRSIIENLQQQKGKPLQHFLITGKRGMGKSTLLRRIQIEAYKPPLSGKLFVVRLGAEQYRLSRLFKLWEMVIEHLGNDEPGLLEQKKELEKSKQYEDNLVFIVNDHLIKTGKTLLLLIDNFDLFIEKIPLKDQHALREALIQFPIQIIGNTVFYNEHFKSYNHPFFDFFKPIHLGNLDKEEAEGFIRRRGISEGIENFDTIFKHQKGKINALRILSGGVPRTLLILLSIVSKKNTGDAVDYLHEMIEQVTPLYQDRMKALSAQQQEIMHNLAMRWDKTPVKELAGEMRIPSKSISAQLLQLEKSGYVKRVDVPGRNHYYEIDERFFNIWLLMSEAAPYDTKRVIWLTKWLDAFYNSDELKGFARFCQNELHQIKPGNRFLIVQALSESEKLEIEYKKKLVHELVGDLKDKMSEVKIWADSYNRKLTETEISLLTEIKKLIDVQDFEGALNRLDLFGKFNESLALRLKASVYLMEKSIDKAEEYYLMAVDKGNIHAMVDLGLLYENEKGDIAGAEKYYLAAADKGDTIALVQLGYLYKNEKKDITSAEKYYMMAAEKGNANAMFNLGHLYLNEKKDMGEAEKYYLMAVDKGDTVAMINLGKLYLEEKKDIVEAEKYYLMAVEKGDTNAMFDLGNLYLDEKKDIIEAEKYYLMAVENGDIGAMNNLGNLCLTEKKDIADAERYYLMAAEKGGAKAMINLGNLYFKEKKDIAGAEKYYLMAVEKGDMSAMFNLGNLYLKEKKDIAGAEKYYQRAAEEGDTRAMVNLGNLYADKKGDTSEAEKYYQMAVEKNRPGAMGNLANLYFEINNVNLKEKALQLSNKAVELTEYSDIILLDIHIGILLWNGEIKDASKLIADVLKGPLHTDDNMRYISEALQYSLVFKQKQMLYRLFSSNKEWIDRYKPVYYALLREMQDEHLKEYLKMTSELEEPVKAIHDFVTKERKRLGI
jgi:TPR repeat protein